MSPGRSGTSQSTSLPSRPRFVLDAKSPPWTDGVVDKDHYARAVRLLCKFHDNMDDSNSAKRSKKNRGIVLFSNIHGQAQRLALSVLEEIEHSEDGARVLVNAIYKRNTLVLVTEVYGEFSTLNIFLRQSSESFSHGWFILFHPLSHIFQKRWSPRATYDFAKKYSEVRNKRAHCVKGVSSLHYRDRGNYL